MTDHDTDNTDPSHGCTHFYLKHKALASEGDAGFISDELHGSVCVQGSTCFGMSRKVGDC